MFEDHKSEKYTTRFPMYWNDTWKLMSVFVLSLAWSPVNKTDVLCLIYHGKRNPQHQLISHLIATQIIKSYTLNFFCYYWYYALYLIPLQNIGYYVISWISWINYKLPLTLFKVYLKTLAKDSYWLQSIISNSIFWPFNSNS